MDDVHRRLEVVETDLSQWKARALSLQTLLRDVSVLFARAQSPFSHMQEMAPASQASPPSTSLSHSSEEISPTPPQPRSQDMQHPSILSTEVQVDPSSRLTQEAPSRPERQWIAIPYDNSSAHRRRAIPVIRPGPYPERL